MADPRLRRRIIRLAVPSALALGGGLAATIALAGPGDIIATPMGQQPLVTPQLRIERPFPFGVVSRKAPITVRIAYEDFDFQPALRTPNAAQTLGSLAQNTVDGVVQGHIHAYVQRLPNDGSFPDVNAPADTFCIPQRVVSQSGKSGVIEGECGTLTPGRYRVSAEFQSNSHVAVLKDGPRAVPTSDVVTVFVR